MTYDLIDEILYLNIEKNNTEKEIAEKLDISNDNVSMIITKMNRSKHKSEVPESPEKSIL